MSSIQRNAQPERGQTSFSVDVFEVDTAVGRHDETDHIAAEGDVDS
jgi:hypothetical protein